MITLQQINKKTRFEVFKRDKFTCRYCQKRFPEIILQVAHVEDFLIDSDIKYSCFGTSCTSCAYEVTGENISSKNQLKVRLELTKFIIKWQKENPHIEKDVVDIIVSFINSKISPFIMTQDGIKPIFALLQKFSFGKIVEGIDIAANKYLGITNETVDQEQVELFIDKIGGVIAVEEMPPVQKKIAYIKGIGRNRFDDWNDRKATILLNYYVSALKKYGWDEERIVNDLTDALIPETKQVADWSDWEDLLKGWTEDIKGWEMQIPSNKVIEKRSLGHDDLSSIANVNIYDAEIRIEALLFLSAKFPTFSEVDLKSALFNSIIEFVNSLKAVYVSDMNVINDKTYVSSFVGTSGLYGIFKLDPSHNQFALHIYLQEKTFDFLTDIFDVFYLPRLNLSRGENIWVLNAFMEFYKHKYDKNADLSKIGLAEGNQ